MKDKKHYKVFVIEDNEGDFTIVEELIGQRMANAEILHANTFKRASSLLRAPGATCDVILLDLTLPDKSGQELVTGISDIALHFPVIILSGYSNIDFSIHSISQGISDYLIKDELNATTLYKSIIYAIERKKSISQLEQSEKRYSDLFHLSPLPMWVYETETFRFPQVNRAAIDHYGYSAEEFLSMTIFDIRPEEELERTINTISVPGHQESGVSNIKIKHRKKTGEMMDVEISSTPIVINDKRYKSVIVNDITEKNRIELSITKAIIKTQEDERYEIGGELHDNVCQILATSQLNLGMLKELLPASGMHWFSQCRDYIILAAQEIRNLSHRLAPAFFDKTTLEEAFGLLLKSFNTDNRYKILLRFNPAVKSYTLNPDLQLNLYRILQEQLRNIQKYAKAGMIQVDLELENDQLTMQVADDGVGFNVHTVKGGIGMANMRRRAALFSGILKLDSTPGNGCTLAVVIPQDALAGSTRDHA